jgi:hypothetical protein
MAAQTAPEGIYTAPEGSRSQHIRTRGWPCWFLVRGFRLPEAGRNGCNMVVARVVTLRRTIRQGSLQDSPLHSPPTELLVRAWLQASQSKAPGRST